MTPRLYGGEVTTRSTLSSARRDIPSMQSSWRRSNLVTKWNVAGLTSSYKQKIAAVCRGSRVGCEFEDDAGDTPAATVPSGYIRALRKFVYPFCNGGQAFQTEDRRPRVHFAPDRWHGEIRIERADARCAHRERHRTGDGGAATGRSFRQTRSVCEHS